MRIAITGGNGFLAWHLRARFRMAGPVEVLPLGRTAFGGEALDDALRGADAVVHAAGMNRGDAAEVERTNRWLAERLVQRLDAVGASPHVVYLSSRQQDQDTPYGRSKRVAGEILAGWGDRVGGPVSVLVLPNVFGEFGRPFYNSVTATFCYQLARGEQPEIHLDREIRLLHAQDVARAVERHLAAGGTEPWTGGREECLGGMPLTVSGLLQQLKVFDAEYAQGVFPALTDDFEIDLFNTYRSYLPAERTTHRLTLRSDERGRLFEAVRSRGKGQIFFSSTNPGITRGNHFHTRKVERFLVLEGLATIRLRRLFDDRVICIDVDGSEPSAVDIPTFHTHDITNAGQAPLLTAFWANEFFNPEHPDTYAENVIL